MRRVVALAVIAGAIACANIGSPPGGPTRTDPPAVTRTLPESGAVNVRAKNVVFEFDAIVADRSIETFFVVSPRDGAPRVRWRRNRVEVRPRGDLLPNTTYSVTMLPGVTDLNNNAIREARTVVFSTGPAIAANAIVGRVFDWSAGRVAAQAQLEAIRLPDSIPYVGVSDSAGRFSIGPLEDGTYLVRAILDNNKNRALDPSEAWDSTRVEVRGVSPVLEMLAAQRDTVPPRLLIVTIADSVTLIASFDRPLDRSQVWDSVFRVQRQDSSALRVVRVMTRAQRDSVSAAAPAPPDSAKPDPRVEMLRNRLAAPSAPADSVRPSRPPPPMELAIRLDSLTPMRPRESYRVTATGIRGITGLQRTSDRVVTMQPPAPPAPRDTTRPVAAPPLTRPPR